MILLLYVTWFIITSFLYSYMSFLYVMWSRNLLKLHSPTSQKSITTKLGSITYKNERVAYFHMTWVNYANVIKATASKVASMKGTNLNRPRHFWLYDTLTNEKEHMQLLQKLLYIKFGRKKTHKVIYLFFRFKIYIINAAS